MKALAYRAAVAAALACAAPANAASIFQSVNFAAETVDPFLQTRTHSGSFSFTYDDVTLESVLHSVDFAIDGTTFTTANTGILVQHTILIGGELNGLNTVAGGSDDFFIRYDRPPNGNFTASAFFYSEKSGLIGRALPGVGTISGGPTNGVPEPSAWAMLIVGFGLVGAAMRHKRIGLRATT